MIWGGLSGKGPGEMAIITLTVSPQVYWTLHIENKFGGD